MEVVKQIRVRFAPSPTGFLHVGGARTAIFNWLFAKNTGGKFLLRIEDTDPNRSRSELSEQIIRSLNWLGLNWDEDVVYQSDRISQHREIVNELIKKGRAYYCFESVEELEQQRKNSERNNEYYRYNRAALNLSKNEVRKLIDANTPYYVRFKVPDGETVFSDIVHGDTIFQNSEIDDFIILRSNGAPVYHISVVTDDHDMGITHVIRGDDHLSNTPKQVLLYNALGWDLPKFAHLPMIVDEQKRKLSKRRNPVAVEEYMDKGYLSEAMFNFLTLLGFAPPDDKEIIPRNELIQMFTLERINKKPAVFDLKKLNWINSEYIKNADEGIIAELLKKYLEKNISELNLPAASAELPMDYLFKIVWLMKERVFTINDFFVRGRYFFTEPDSYDPKGVSKYWNNNVKILLAEYLNDLKNAEYFNTDFLEKHLREFTGKKNIKPADIIHPLRLALTGITISPGIFDVMAVLGMQKVIKRINKMIEEL
jgi:glutamyl-tRNA synthetase